MWKVVPTPEYERRHKTYQKKHRRELRAVLDNLDTFVKALEGGASVQQIQYGFVHREPRGVRAIDQRGKERALRQTRLYIYPDEKTKTVHLLILGDKRSQSKDIKFCSSVVTKLIRSG